MSLPSPHWRAQSVFEGLAFEGQDGAGLRTVYD